MANTRDGNHLPAIRFIRGASLRLVTSNLVVIETHALMLRRLGRHIALRYIEGLLRGDVAIERVQEADERTALEIVRRYDDKDFSLTDATSFALMDRLGVIEAFTFDRNFSQYGLGVLPH